MLLMQPLTHSCHSAQLLTLLFMFTTAETCQVISKLLKLSLICSLVTVRDDVMFVDDVEGLCYQSNSYNVYNVSLILHSIWLTSDYTQRLYFSGNRLILRSVCGVHVIVGI